METIFDLQRQFTCTENTHKKRFEFQAKTNKTNSYSVSFGECDDSEVNAWISLSLAVQKELKSRDEDLIKYEWLKNTKHAWVQGLMLFPVKVSILNINFESKQATIRTIFQSGEIDFDKIYRYKSECPCG